MRIPIYHVNAFSSGRFTGNPAAVCPLQAWLDDGLLGKVAAENNLSETAFWVADRDHYQLRWFTPRSEVKLCGHATLGSAHVLLSMLQTTLPAVRFETRFSGTLTVRREGDLLCMDFPAMFAKVCSQPPPALAQGLGLTRAPSSVLEANQKYIAVYENEATIEKLCPDLAMLEKLHPFTLGVTAPGQESDFVCRYFAPSYGVPEDPVTGSVHCALAPYWATRLGKTKLHSRQLSERGGEMWCEVAGDRVLLKGRAMLTLEGSLEI